MLTPIFQLKESTSVCNFFKKNVYKRLQKDSIVSFNLSPSAKLPVSIIIRNLSTKLSKVVSRQYEQATQLINLKSETIILFLHIACSGKKKIYPLPQKKSLAQQARHNVKLCACNIIVEFDSCNRSVLSQCFLA